MPEISVALATSGTFAIPLMLELGRRGWLKVLISKPPARMGRSLKLKPMPPVEALKSAQERGELREEVHIIELPTFRDKERREEVVKLLRGVDALLVCDFGLFVPRRVREAPRIALNLHPSLLPAYRGAAPIERALLRGESETGLSLALLTGEMDAGPIFRQWKVEIHPQDDRLSLREKLSKLASEVVPDVIAAILRGDLRAHPQTGTPSEAPKITSEELHLRRYRTPTEFIRAVRALKPEAYLRFKGKRLKILGAEFSEYVPETPPWRLSVVRKELVLKLPEGAVKLTHLHPASKKPMRAIDFINGYAPAGEEVT